jgi:hypothetical protein
MTSPMPAMSRMLASQISIAACGSHAQSTAVPSRKLPAVNSKFMRMLP